MGRPRASEHLIRKVWELAENNPDWTAGKIVYQLKYFAKQEGIQERLPSERTIARYRKELSGKSQEERLLFRYFSWPEAMEMRALPWEASRACLELLACQHQEGRDRPLIKFVKWFWKVTQAAPDADIEKRIELAAKLSIFWSPESSSAKEKIQGLEWYLAYAPWKSEQNRRDYEGALAGAQGEPVPSLPVLTLTLPQLAAGDTLPPVESYARISPMTRRRARDIIESRQFTEKPADSGSEIGEQERLGEKWKSEQNQSKIVPPSAKLRAPKPKPRKRK